MSNSTTEGGGGRGTGESLAADGQHALSEPPSAHRPLALPAPGEGTQVEQEGATTLEVGGESVKMDKLGPLIVNSDGTLSRITNWHELTENEQERMVRLIVKKRNKERLAAQVAASSASLSDSLSIVSSTPLPSSSSPQPPSNGSQGSLADPREEGEDKQRSIEEKIVGLMDAVRKDTQA